MDPDTIARIFEIIVIFSQILLAWLYKWIAKLEKTLHELQKTTGDNQLIIQEDMTQIKLNYLDRFDKLKNAIALNHLDLVQKMSNLEGTILKTLIENKEKGTHNERNTK